MALPLGKLTILVGAGILGSVLAKEGRLPSVPDFVSSAFKIALKQTKRDSTSSSSKPINESLMAQVNSLRQELQMLASNRPITIVTAAGTGTTKYGTIILVVVVGYGYVWWKGWKLPDMMFATRRSLSDACNTVGLQLENVYGSIRSTKRELSSNVEKINSTLDEVAALTADTHGKVAGLLEESSKHDHAVRNVRQHVQSLGLKISKMEERQGITLLGVKKLVDVSHTLDNESFLEHTQDAQPGSRIAFPLKNALPPASSEPASPSSSGRSLEVQRSLSFASSAAVQQRSNGISGAVEVADSQGISAGNLAAEESNSGTSSWFRPFLMRTRSATSAVVNKTNSSKQQS